MQNVSFLTNVLYFLLASITVITLLYKLKLSPVLGYLIIGALINNYNLIQEQEYIHKLADFGIIFLLFAIGIELSFDKLKKMKIYVFGFGSLQIIITMLLITLTIHCIFSLHTITSILISISLALSSTAIVLQVLNDSGHRFSQVGRLSLSTLLMQDFTIVPLLAILPIIANNTNNNFIIPITLVIIKALIAIYFIIIVARVTLKPFFLLITSIKIEEIYVTTALFIILVSAWFTNKINLSTAMGSFIAGILIAETKYKNKFEKIVYPFQILFMGLFFINIGMTIDIDFIKKHLNLILLASFILIFTKSIVIMFLCRAFNFQWGTSIHSALLLAQGGEFAFILFDLATKQGIININCSKFGLMTVTLSMATTPLLAIIGSKIEIIIDSIKNFSINNKSIAIKNINKHVVIVDFKNIEQILRCILKKKHIHYIAVGNKFFIIKKTKNLGYIVNHDLLNDESNFLYFAPPKEIVVILIITEKKVLKTINEIIINKNKNFHIVYFIKNYNKNILKVKIKKFIIEKTVRKLYLNAITLKNFNFISSNFLNIKKQIKKNNHIINNNDFFNSNNVI